MTGRLGFCGEEGGNVRDRAGAKDGLIDFGDVGDESLPVALNTESQNPTVGERHVAMEAEGSMDEEVR